MKRPLRSLLPAAVLAAALLSAAQNIATAERSPRQLCKVEDIIIYQDDKFYSAFPSIVRRPNGELITAFRRAPNRRLLGEKSVSHTDPNSYLILVRSHDGGKSWSREPEHISRIRSAARRTRVCYSCATARSFAPATAGRC